MSAERAAEALLAELMTRTGEASPQPRLEPVRRLAALLGDPQRDLRIIQVAGTNGKTSTARAIATLLSASGLRTGLFTSPHLRSFTERFLIDGEPVPGDRLTEVWHDMAPALGIVDAELTAAGEPRITFFEALAVLALAVFADAPVEVAVLEVGMGGEWDATNLVEAEVAVFTPIDLDHVGILGDTIAEIARTKAGIIDAGATVVSAAQDPAALAELRARAEGLDARFFLAGEQFGVRDDRVAVGGRYVAVTGIAGEYAGTLAPLFGRHQAQNLALAVAAVEALFGAERPLTDEVIEEAFAHTTSPGRLELIGLDPQIYADAAHNPHGARALAAALEESFDFSGLAIVFGSFADKDSAGVIRELAGSAELLITAASSSNRSRPAEELAEIARDAYPELDVRAADTLGDALEEARAWALDGDNRGVLVCGSVVLVGEAMTYAEASGWKEAR